MLRLRVTLRNYKSIFDYFYRLYRRYRRILLVEIIVSSSSNVFKYLINYIRITYNKIITKLIEFVYYEDEVWADTRYKIYKIPNTPLVGFLISSFLIRSSRLN